jgi:hypothetical protein
MSARSVQSDGGRQGTRLGTPCARLGTCVALAVVTACGSERSGSPGPTPDEPTSIAVSPAAVELEPTQQRQFVAQIQDFAGNALNLPVNWQASAGSITQAGLFSAPSIPIELFVFAQAEATSLRDSAWVRVVRPAAPADPMLLPIATGQLPNTMAYQALAVPGRPAGFSYTDPSTAVRVWKVTSATVPVANGTAAHDYSEGGQEISRPWGPARDRYTIKVLLADRGAHWLVDFQLGVGFSNWRPIVRPPDGDLAWSFSNNAATPRIAYSVSGGRLYRIDTSTNSDAPLGPFPYADTFVSSPWLSVDKNDLWFTWMKSSTTAVAWNSQTRVRREFSDPTLNEIRLHPDGDWAQPFVGNNNPRFWNLTSGEVTPALEGLRLVHHATLRGGIALTMDVDDQIPPDAWRVQAGWPPGKVNISQSGFAGYAYHASGNWIQSDSELGGNLLHQWALFSSAGIGPGVGFPVNDPRHLLQNALGYIRADGSERRLLAHSYGLDDGVYWGQAPRGKSSPDGRLVLFDSNMLASGRSDVFLVEVPAR